jgi:hypothetical protein
MKARTPSDLIPLDPMLRRIGSGPVGIGLDLATTEKKTSNPSSLTVSEQAGPLIIEHLTVRWKTSDERVTKAVLRHICEALAMARRHIRGIAVDASSEKFMCAQIAREFTKFAPVRQIVSGEKTRWKNEDLSFKQLLGNLYSALYEDALIAIAPAVWLADDRRLVQRDRGSFIADLGANGEHGDTFDSGKLAYWCLVKSGRAEAVAAGLSSDPASPAVLSRLKNWMVKKAGAHFTRPYQGNRLVTLRSRKTTLISS